MNIVLLNKEMILYLLDLIEKDCGFGWAEGIPSVCQVALSLGLQVDAEAADIEGNLT